MIDICRVDARGLFAEHRLIQPTDSIPEGWFVMPPPEDRTLVNLRVGASWEVLEEEPPYPLTQQAFVPIRISRLDFRRLLLPQEAAIFRILEAAPKVTATEIAQAFDPENPNFGLQLRIAVEDAIQQWNLLDQGVIEINHPETRQFLDVMAMAGMFGSDPVAAQARVEDIIAQRLPQS